MSAPKKVFGIILAGGEGKRLMPLTADRAKPAVPFGGQYRLIDFAISNLINSGLRQVVVLTQYKSHSLDRHVSQNWRMSALLDSYVTSVPAQQRLGKRWFSGSADAILQSLNLINDEKPDIVVVIGADHVYRMDFQQMIDAHIASGAPATVAGIRQPIALASQFGVIDADPDTGRIRDFLEKPADPVGLSDSPDEVLVSMGNYVFNADALVAAVEADGESASSGHDMGGDIIPYFVQRGEAGYYDMKQNDVPGSSPRDRSYWRDVGTIDSYFDAHMDLISTLPIFNLYNTDWPIRTQNVNMPPAKFVRDAVGRIGNAIDSIVAAGSVLSGTHIERSVIGLRGVALGGSTITDSVLLDNVHMGLGSRVRRAVLDKNVILEDGATVGVDRERDLERGFTVTDSGITVVGKGVRVTR
ncbi:glucose-1-phosphate adenylyltransferase [Microbacterium sp. NPDC077391]|uniref:glucose-1-phosphate adenylyltransferase n=1 Tax=unclassified Microbacterium TaxID=2609290 RepID=UPI0008FC88C1|nr:MULTISPECIES: glucose-1-phosphate adenylyltransferase [unclassified Microbacterium]OIU87387.1 glucose-1-phosphate adenylyltransferase [Microbacterium sp. AR7-10]